MSLRNLTISQLAVMVQLQNEANSVMSDAWLDSNNTEIWYFRAGLNELIELEGHMGIKWWKNEHPTEELKANAFEQATIELVDYMHFSLSDHARTYFQHYQISGNPLDNEGVARGLLHVAREANTANAFNHKSELFDVVERSAAVIASSRFANWNHAVTLSEAMGLDGNHLFNLYVGKNILNKFRTSNGQREGTYHKIWDGVEDNVCLSEILNGILARGEEIKLDEVTEKLGAKYKQYRDLELTQFA